MYLEPIELQAEWTDLW